MKSKKKIIIVAILLVCLVISHPRRVCNYKASDIGRIEVFSLFYGRPITSEDQADIERYVKTLRNTWYITVYIPLAYNRVDYEVEYYDKNGERMEEYSRFRKGWGDMHHINLNNHRATREICEEWNEMSREYIRNEKPQG